MNAFSRSWNLTKLSFRVIQQDKEMLLFPFLGGLFSLLYSLALLFPTLLIQFTKVSVSEIVVGPIEYALMFASYLGLAFIATFFNVCVVYTTKVRFEGGDATFMESIKFSMSKLHLILMWALVSATVGLIMRALDSAAERAGGIGKIVIGILTALFGMMWTVVSMFVVPAMVYNDLGPFAAMKNSVNTLKKTWGESLIRHYGLGLIQLVFVVLGTLLSIGLFVGLTAVHPSGAIIAIMLAVSYFLALTMIFNIANSVFNTALYAYANNGVCPAGFDRETLQGAVGTKS